MTSFERGQALLEEMTIELSSRARPFEENEATTRLHLIDGILQDVLNWPTEQIKCEDHIDGEYLDYVLGSPERRAVVEAKRAGIHFETPAGVKTGIISLSTLRDYSRQNRKAVDQVLGYCQSAGIALAILSNGHQFVGFLGSRSDGKKPIDGKAVLFDSLSDAFEQFSSFWDYFSHEGVNRGDLFRALSSQGVLVPPPAPLSSYIHSYPGYRMGSGMEIDLRILGDLFIQDVVREESVTDEFLADCYCSSGALSQYAKVSKEILKTRYLLLNKEVNVESAVEKHGTSKKLKEDLIGVALTRRPIVLLGDVGIGKSIFLKHFFRVEAKDFLVKTVVFNVDFLKHSGLVVDVPTHIVGVISQTLAERHGIDINEANFVRSVYNKEINAFKRGLFGTLEQDDPSRFRGLEIEMLQNHISNQYEHAKRSLSFLQASQSYSFVVVLDNVDQHQSSFQEQIFVAGQSMAETWPSAVFMSLRPDTFHESRRSGALAAFQPRVFTVSPPRSDLVVIRRLEFARKQMVVFGRLPSFPTGLTIDSKSLLTYIDALLEAFRSNEQLIDLIDNLSSGNTRRALDFVSTFVGSGYVQTARILELDKVGDSYTVPRHEFLRAILFGDHNYYDPESSLVPNLFSVVSNSSSEHFLLPLLLAFVQSLGERQLGGFTDKAHVYAQLQGLGFSVDQINAHLLRAEKSNLVESTEVGGGGGPVRITPAGGYMHKILVADFTYLDAVVVDTPILDAEARALIRDVSDIGDRIQRAEAFVEYLDKCWTFGDEKLPFSWRAIRKDWNESLRKVKTGANRAASKRPRS